MPGLLTTGSPTAFPSNTPQMTAVWDRQPSLLGILQLPWWNLQILTLRESTESPSRRRTLLAEDLSHSHTFLTVPLQVGASLSLDQLGEDMGWIIHYLIGQIQITEVPY